MALDGDTALGFRPAEVIALLPSEQTVAVIGPDGVRNYRSVTFQFEPIDASVVESSQDGGDPLDPDRCIATAAGPLVEVRGTLALGMPDGLFAGTGEVSLLARSASLNEVWYSGAVTQESLFSEELRLDTLARATEDGLGCPDDQLNWAALSLQSVEATPLFGGLRGDIGARLVSECEAAELTYYGVEQLGPSD